MSEIKKILVFGHTSGLGLEITKKFISHGYEVVGVARREFPEVSKKMTNIQADLSDKKDVDSVIKTITQDHPKFNKLVFCSGMLVSHDIDDIDYEDLLYQYKVNLFAAMVIESALLDLIKQNEADLLNVTSSSIVDYYPSFSEYSSSKLALKKFTADLKKELDETSCRVTEFCPGGFKSNIYQTMRGDKIDRDESSQMEPKDLADLIYYLMNLPKKIEIANIYVDRK
jgi:NADP-dependent 3-hydroxy acid dehydrogenase YdfG